MASNAKVDGNVSVGASHSQPDVTMKAHGQGQDQLAGITGGIRWQPSSIAELLFSINHVTNSDDADLKKFIADRNLPAGKLKTQRQYIIIENIVADSISSLITGAMQKVSDNITSAIHEMSTSVPFTTKYEWPANPVRAASTIRMTNCHQRGINNRTAQ
jgi:hypothetical protein